MADIKALARQLRQNPTPAQKHLWSVLSKKRLCGYKFRRSHPLRAFIVDFYCYPLKMIIEIIDDDLDEWDYSATARPTDAWAHEHGYHIFRIKAGDVLCDRGIVILSLITEIRLLEEKRKHRRKQGNVLPIQRSNKYSHLEEVLYFSIPKIQTWGGKNDKLFKQEIIHLTRPDDKMRDKYAWYVFDILVKASESRSRLFDIENIPKLIVDAFTGVLYPDDDIRYVRGVQAQIVWTDKFEEIDVKIYGKRND